MRNTIATFCFSTGYNVDGKLQARSAGSGREAPTGVGTRWERRRHQWSCRQGKQNWNKTVVKLNSIERILTSDFFFFLLFKLLSFLNMKNWPEALIHWPGTAAREPGSSSSLMGKCPEGWWEKESKKDELLMPRLTPVTPIPSESVG